MVAIDRRQLLGRAGLAFGALAAAGLGWTRPLAEALAGTGPGLTPARLQTYRALVVAVAAGGHGQIDASRAEWAAERFAADYAARLPDNQAQIDALLDTLDASPRRTPFARLARGRRLGHLRDLSASTPAERDLAERATALAALPFAPSPDDDFHPVPVAL